LVRLPARVIFSHKCDLGAPLCGGIVDEPFDQAVLRAELSVEAHLRDARLREDVVDAKAESFLEETAAGGREEAVVDGLVLSAGRSGRVVRVHGSLIRAWNRPRLQE